MDLVSTFSMELVNKAMDGLSQRQKAIASNLANVDTPNYHRRDVTFEGSLQQALAQRKKASGRTFSPRQSFGMPLLDGGGTFASQAGTQYTQASNETPLEMHASHHSHLGGQLPFNSISEIEPQWVTDTDSQFRLDENGVDIEREMVQMTKTSGKYQSLANLQSRQIRTLRTAIDKGG